MADFATMDASEFNPKSPNYAGGECESSDQHSDDHRVDSGYNSLTATPATDASSEKSSGRFKLFPNEGDDEAESCTRRLFSPRSDLDCFEKPLDDGTLRWFETTAPRIEQLLVEFLKSGRRFLSPKFKPIAVRLMVLGRSEASARPHLVVFSPPKGSKKIEKFFAREEVKDLLCPSGGFAPVSVIVTAHTTGFLMCLISDVKALCSSDRARHRPRHTLCGLPITVNSRLMTLGGIVRVLVSAGNNETESKLYGLTAGHFIDGLDDEGDDDEPEDSDEESESDAHTVNEDPVYDAPEVRPLNLPLFTPETRPWEWSESMTLGNILELGGTGDASPDLDWSLIHMNCLLPNFLDSMSMGLSDGNYRMADLTAPRSIDSNSSSALPPLSNTASRNVVVVSGTRGLQRGRLQNSPTRVMLGRSETFSNAYILKLETGVVGPGDSGSWVVDPCTSEVLGHVVAKDVFGDAYVIPMTDILNDIKSRLGCIDVGLPSSLDVFAEATTLKCLSGTLSSPPGSPKTPTLDCSPADSGYNTFANVTPSSCIPEPPDHSPALAPSTTEIHALIRASLPQDRSAERQEQANYSSSDGFERLDVDQPQKRRRIDWEFPPEENLASWPRRVEIRNTRNSPDGSVSSSIYSGHYSGYSSSRFSGGSSSATSEYHSSTPTSSYSGSASSRSSAGSERVYRSGHRNSGYYTDVRGIPPRRGTDIVIIHHGGDGHSNQKDEPRPSEPRPSHYYR
ncbi:hypothetical protein B0T16DRAFT_414482 [Cercophora newfieldiana]|uniref:Uncharacterized protein n=1 Tax=Cercophora newfieldiana TaxID=92897 RepID=A0AA39Y6G7_9PEZI|nr:hypothetical protein B0T16DRAFT_414482 [Cercophora newfieldiana]